MAVTAYANNKLLSLLMLIVMVFLASGRLNSQFPVSEPTKQSKGEGGEKGTRFSRFI